MATNSGRHEADINETTQNVATSDAQSTTKTTGTVITKKSWGQALGAAAIAAVIVSLILMAFSWPTVTSEPKDIPMATVGSADKISQVTQNAPEGMFDIREAKTRDEAIGLIKHREVYGAFMMPDDPKVGPEILKATAAAPAVAQILTGIGNTMQTSIDEKTIEGMQKALATPHRQEPVANNSGQPGQAAQSSGAVEVKVTDVVPFSENDSNGTGLAVAGFPLTIGGIVGGILIAVMVPSRRMRAVAIVAYSAIGGVALAAILQGWFDLIQGDFWTNIAIAGLSVGATAAIINGFVSIIGNPGIGVGAVLTMFIGNPISGVNAPRKFLPGAWGEIGQWFVPGASGTLLRNASYLPEAAESGQWITLILWAVAGFVLILVGHLRSLKTNKS